jgi:hypothetical protein
MRIAFQERELPLDSTSKIAIAVCSVLFIATLMVLRAYDVPLEMFWQGS